MNMYGISFFILINLKTNHYYFFYYLLTNSDNHKVTKYNQINHAQLNFVIKLKQHTYVS